MSDIGLEGQKVETNLQRVFDLAGLWEAVLLLYVWEGYWLGGAAADCAYSDEADVFLESRDKSDIQRNTIVSGKSASP